MHAMANTEPKTIKTYCVAKLDTIRLEIKHNANCVWKNLWQFELKVVVGSPNNTNVAPVFSPSSNSEVRLQGRF